MLLEMQRKYWCGDEKLEDDDLMFTAREVFDIWQQHYDDTYSRLLRDPRAHVFA